MITLTIFRKLFWMCTYQVRNGILYKILIYHSSGKKNVTPIPLKECRSLTYKWTMFGIIPTTLVLSTIQLHVHVLVSFCRYWNYCCVHQHLYAILAKIFCKNWVDVMMEGWKTHTLCACKGSTESEIFWNVLIYSIC